MNTSKISSRHGRKREVLDKKYVGRALDSGFLAGSGKIVSEYEKYLSLYFKKDAVALSSGTASIHSSLYALGVKGGDEVILPATAPIMTVLPIIALGARPVFVDIQKNNFGLDIESVKRNISKKTKVIISVAMWGYPTFKIRELSKLAQSKGISLLEDSSQSIGTINKGKLEGTFGDVGCFSTHEFKLISTGEGGFAIASDSDLIERIRSFSRFGFSNEKNKKGLGYNFGLNYKSNGLVAALGISQVKQIDKHLKERKKIASSYEKKFNDLSGFIKPFLKESKLMVPSYYGYIFVLKDSRIGYAKEVADYLKKNDIVTDYSAYNYRPLYRMDLFKDCVSGIDIESEFKNTEYLFDSIIILPTSQNIGSKEIKRIHDVLFDFFKNNKKQSMYLSKKDDKYSICGLSRIEKKRVVWELTDDCTRSCKYCFIRKDCYKGRKGHLKPLNTKEVIRAIKKLKKLGYRDVQITGGEPFLRKDIFEILEEFTKNDFQIAISTNGDLTTKDVLRKLSKYNIRSINTSIDSHLEKVNDSLRGKGSFKAATKLIKEVAGSGVRLRVHTVISKHNKKNIDKLIDYLYDLGVRLHTISSELPGIESYDKSFVSKIITSKKKHKDMEIDLLRIKSSEKQEPDAWVGCSNGSKLIGIYPDGTLTPCTLMLNPKKESANIFKDSVFTIRKFLSTIDGSQKNKEYPCVLKEVI